jgi:hypothetical protein
MYGQQLVGSVRRIAGGIVSQGNALGVQRIAQQQPEHRQGREFVFAALAQARLVRMAALRARGGSYIVSHELNLSRNKQSDKVYTTNSQQSKFLI